MNINTLPIEGPLLIELDPYSDSRGFFVRSFCKNELSYLLPNKEIVQINQSYTKNKGAFRGFHFQQTPFAEAKFIRCLNGKVVDIIIDIRKNSPTFLEHIMLELTEGNFKMLYVPEGFAHGFQTLEDNSELLYLHTEFYNPNYEGGLNVYDKKLNIGLPLDISEISERDKSHPLIENNFKGIEL